MPGMPNTTNQHPPWTEGRWLRPPELAESGTGLTLELGTELTLTIQQGFPQHPWIPGQLPPLATPPQTAAPFSWETESWTPTCSFFSGKSLHHTCLSRHPWMMVPLQEMVLSSWSKLGKSCDTRAMRASTAHLPRTNPCSWTSNLLLEAWRHLRE